MSRTTPRVTTTTVFAVDRSPISSRAIAKSACPVENALMASNSVPLSTTFSRTGADGRGQSSGERRHQLGRNTVERTNSNAQRCRMRGITIAEQASPAREYHQATHKYNPQPTWQSSCNNCENDSCQSCAYCDSLQFFSLHHSVLRSFEFAGRDPPWSDIVDDATNFMALINHKLIHLDRIRSTGF